MIFATLLFAALSPALNQGTATGSLIHASRQTAAGFPAGEKLYEQRCATCHAANLGGSKQGPSLRGVGAADIDFMVGTGRMPAAVPWVEPDHHEPVVSRADIDALIGYITTRAPGGAPIPVVPRGGDAAHGKVIFSNECMHCHSATMDGAAIGGSGEYAPKLSMATATQIAEAIRVGPGEMPRFDAHRLSDRDIADVQSYIFAQRSANEKLRAPADSGGVVAEGLIAWLAVAVIAAGAYALAKL